MSPSSVFVSGLNFEKIRQVMYALRDDIELSQVYYSTVYLVEEFYTLIATEMRSVKKDITYWETLAESSHWEIYLTQIHNKIYRRVVKRGDGSLFEMSKTFHLSMSGIKRLLDPPTIKDVQDRQESQDEDDIDRHLSMLHADFNCLACLLALVEESAAHLKLIFNRVHAAHVPSFSPSNSFINMTSVTAREISIGTIDLDASFESIAKDDNEASGSADLCDVILENNRNTKRIDRRSNYDISIHQNAREALINCLNHISKSFELFLKHINTNAKLQKIYFDHNNATENDNNDLRYLAKESQSVLSIPTVFSTISLPVTDLTNAYSKAENRISKIIKSQDNSKFYPIGITDLKARRPSKQERYWALNTVLCGGMCYIGYLTLKHIQNGYLQKQCGLIKDHVTALVAEHIVEPITKLGDEFFEKLHRREGIVSREDLVQSREALTRMLADFSKHGQRSYDVRQMLRGSSGAPSGFNDATPHPTPASSTTDSNSSASKSSSTVSKSSPTGSGTSTSTGTNNISMSDEMERTNETAAMESLMRTYEKQLQSPIYGMLYGNLMTAMLIQMQKLKVHTEAAMLTMDQILASNELTMAATAAMPAMVLIAGVTVLVRQALRPRASSPGHTTLTLRLAMSDVEKSLQEVYSTPPPCSSSPQSAGINAEGRARAPSLSPFPRSPSLHFPPSQSSQKLSRKDRNGPGLGPLLLPQNIDLEADLSVMVGYDSDEELNKEIQHQKNAEEGKQLVAKGILSFNLHRLRDALGALFITSYWQGNTVYNKNKKWSMLINRDRENRASGRLRRFLYANNTIKSEYFPYRKLHTFSTSIFTSYFQMVSSFISSVFGQIDPSVAIEYKAVISDLLLLSSPNFEISGVRKIATAVRMRNTYRCLIPPKVY